MRIVHVVCSDRFAGVERYLTYVAPALVARGHQVCVLGGDPKRMGRQMNDSRVELRPSATVREAARELVKRRGRVDVVHVHMTDAEFVGVALRPILRVPVVATLHFAKPRGSSPLRRAVADTTARGLAAQVAISQFVADRSGVADATVIPTGVAWSEPVRARQPVVLVAQRLEPEKDGAIAVRAWERSRLAEDGWRMVVAGDGSLRHDLRRLAVDLDVHGSIDFIGNTDELASMMSTASLFLSTCAVESFGLSVVEAMAAGLPVVASAAGAHLETVGRASDRFLFPAGDSNAAAQLLRELAHDPARRERYGYDLRDAYRAWFTIDAHAHRLSSFYGEVTDDFAVKGP